LTRWGIGILKMVILHHSFLREYSFLGFQIKESDV
jgi:hypothetical protein